MLIPFDHAHLMFGIALRALGELIESQAIDELLQPRSRHRLARERSTHTSRRHTNTRVAELFESKELSNGHYCR